MRRAAAIVGLIVLAGCHAQVAPQVLQEWQAKTLFTCCNIRYEGEKVSDANYAVGSTLPFGSPAVIEAMTTDSATLRSGGTKLTLVQNYGREQESAEQYFGKILVGTDPHTRFATFPKMAQAAVTDGRVELGMTKEQVLMSLGYPPTHRTASTELDTWTYWYNRWVTYQVIFSKGVVQNLVGNAPTHNEPIVVATPKPTPPPKGKARGKSK